MKNTLIDDDLTFSKLISIYIIKEIGENPKRIDTTGTIWHYSQNEGMKHFNENYNIWTW